MRLEMKVCQTIPYLKSQLRS